MAETEKKPAVDWDAVAIDIRAGLLTDREIGAKHGRSHTSIQKYAAKNGIERDLTARIQQKTKAKVAKAQVAKKGCQELAKLTQEQTVEIAAEAAATIIIKQQGRIGRHLALSQALLSEIEAQTIDRDLYEKLGDLMSNPDESGLDRLNQLYRKIIDTPSRIDSHKKAVETEKTLISLERQAFNLDKETEGNGGIAEAIRKALEE